MLVNKKYEVRWNTNNIKHYKSLGYVFTHKNDTFLVLVEHLPINSSIFIDLICDYCDKPFQRKLVNYTYCLKKNNFHKDACDNCKELRRKDNLKSKQMNGILTREIDGYWTFKENRLKELNEYIKTYKTLDGISKTKEGFLISSNFHKNNHLIVDGVIELGYNPLELYKRMPEGYYDNFDIIESLIRNFIDKYGKFPTVSEMKYEFKFDTRHISKHGGVNKVKQKMGYVDELDMVDDNGYYNRSAYEYIVAQYLIHNNVTYKREQYPFSSEEGLYRSDFTLCPKGSKEIHVEVWGMDSSENYIKTKKKKLELYEKYNIQLISINQNTFVGKSLYRVQEILYSLFSQYVNLEYEKIDKKYLVTPNSLSDQDLFELLMEFSSDGKTLPTTTTLKEKCAYGLYNQVIKRYGNYASFAKHFSVSNHHKRFYWTEQEIEYQLNIVNQNKKDLSRKSFNELNLSGLMTAIDKSKGMIQTRLDYYDNNNVNFIHDKDLKILNNIIMNKGTNIKNHVTLKQQEQAKRILEKYYSKSTLTPIK